MPILVSCVAKKAERAAPARELYRSTWFKKAAAYARASGEPWWILSAEHGLVHPERVIAPYERTLNRMGKPERRAWALRVFDQITTQIDPDERIEVFAGERYRAELVPMLERAGYRVAVPFARLGIGEQLHELDVMRAELAARRGAWSPA